MALKVSLVSDLTMRGIATPLSGWAKSPVKVRRLGASGHVDVRLEVRALRARIARIELRLRTPSLSPRRENELLDELRKSLNRLKVLESLKAGQGEIEAQTPSPDDDSSDSSPPREAERPPTRAWTWKATTMLLVALLLAGAAVWALNQHGAAPGTGFDVFGPRWKDESVTHFSFAASGDFGGPGDRDSTALALRARTAGMSFLLALGDLGNPADEAAWCGNMKRYVPEVVIVPGNHDVGEEGGNRISEYVKSCPYPWNSPVVPGVDTPGYGYEYYFDYPAEKPLARFIMISPGVGGGLKYNYSEESPHTEWLEDAADSARDQGIPWVIAGAHAQCITIGMRAHCAMGQSLFDELVEAKVDLILVGGDHAYERSKQLQRSDSCESVKSTGPADPSCIAGDGRRDWYPKGNGTVVVVQGVGGEDLDNITVDGSNPQIGYFAEAMGRNANTHGGLPGFGSVFYTVTGDSITAKTDFCPTGSVGPTGRCAANLADVFTDRFSISDSGSDPALSPLSTPDRGADSPGGSDSAHAFGATAAVASLSTGTIRERKHFRAPS